MADLSRRDMLYLLATPLALGGCQSISHSFISKMSPPDRAFDQSQDLVQSDVNSKNESHKLDPAYRLLNRAAFGPSPGDLARLRKLGAVRWIDEQLNPEKIDDSRAAWRLRRFESLLLDPASCYDFKKEVLRRDLTLHTMLSGVFSKRQLFEVMVGFWSDHFNISLEKGDCIYLKPADDRDVIRKHALGSFKDLLRASALSPAMLVYLDGAQNKYGSGSPNENYARELMELHTLGVNGGYTQHDVGEAARALTGWTVGKGSQRGKVWFEEKYHDDGVKTVLGKTIPSGGGRKDLDRLIEIVATHSSTAKYIAYKLCRHFVADEPPAALVSNTASVFRATDGDIKAVVASILNSREFASVPELCRVKRPMHYIISALRTTGADTFGEGFMNSLSQMGQGLFEYPTPDGYPDDSSFWTGSLLFRWNFAMALASGTIPDMVPPDLERLEAVICRKLNKPSDIERATALFSYFIGRLPDDREMSVLGQHKGPELIGLILASPAFQRC